jgi:hypothetical protein
MNPLDDIARLFLRKTLEHDIARSSSTRRIFFFNGMLPLKRLIRV